MHLKSIKLTGFKSFVDSTTIPIKNHINAIVGPNGCGKSNVVDAIRWVIGESSAKQLRGQSMADVIFNGTTSRKPIGQASVELFFSNEEGRIVGEYAGYNEIAVRREVDRDGQSRYYLNNTLCRRRDIVDIFLGTGLGPRSYAIIEQGMISRLIEAKPEEMRVYVEEAAGISKYKERRRETENRMRHTQENLERLNDLREEVNKQLRHLKRQANAAERYRVLKQEERELQVQIKALQWQQMQTKIQAKQQELSQQQVLLDEQQARLQSLATQRERQQQSLVEVTEQQNTVQRQFYSLGADIARLEQRINHTQQSITQWQQELADSEALFNELSDSSQEHQEQVTELNAELEDLNPQSDVLQRALEISKKRLKSAQQAMQNWQERWDNYQATAFDIQQELSVLQTKLQHNQQSQQQSVQQVRQLQQDQDQAQLNVLRDAINPLTQQTEQLQQRLHTKQTELAELDQRITQQRQDNHQQQVAVEDLRNTLSELKTQQASKLALQQAALDSGNEEINAWLDKQQLSHLPRLGQVLQVDAGWEQAVEMVLGADFAAVCVENIDAYCDQLNTLSQGQLSMVAQSAETGDISADTLASKVRGNYSLLARLKAIHVAADVSAAQVLIKELAANESVITASGVWLGHGWVRVAKSLRAEDSILQREQELKTLAEKIAVELQQLQHLQQALQAGQSALDNAEQQRQAAQQDYQALSEEYTQLQAKLSAEQSRLNELAQQHLKQQQSLESCQTQLQQLQQQRGELQQRFDELTNKQQRHQEIKEDLLVEKNTRGNELEQARTAAQQEQQRFDEIDIRVSANENQLAVLKQTLASNERQLCKLTERRDTLTSQLSTATDPLTELKAELQAKLDERLKIESQLQAAQAALREQNELQESLQTEQNTVNETISELRTVLQNLQLEQQALAVRQTTIQEQVEETDYQLTDVLDNLPEEARLDEWQQRCEELTQKISRLGPINLAAIDEHATLSERKDYLDQQFADLEEALDVLNNAIRKIDKETRERFRETFERINHALQQLFPQIFGGGRAYLELLEDDVLKTGVIIRAQPPGKRNTSIHLLSGGEKALTALAFVFAVFQLNPAPFCILDEVDAPLDDVNVGRFCQIVKQMAQQTQFIVISHNKVTIEAADYLMGVTMQEAGVSRIVSVDMANAVEMATA